MYAEDFDEEIEAWNKIDINLNLFDSVKKHVSEVTLGLLVSGNFKSIIYLNFEEILRRLKAFEEVRTIAWTHIGRIDERYWEIWKVIKEFNL